MSLNPDSFAATLHRVAVAEARLPQGRSGHAAPVNEGRG